MHFKKLCAVLLRPSERPPERITILDGSEHLSVSLQAVHVKRVNGGVGTEAVITWDAMQASVESEEEEKPIAARQEELSVVVWRKCAFQNIFSSNKYGILGCSRCLRQVKRLKSCMLLCERKQQFNSKPFLSLIGYLFSVDKITSYLTDQTNLVRSPSSLANTLLADASSVICWTALTSFSTSLRVSKTRRTKFACATATAASIMSSAGADSDNYRGVFNKTTPKYPRLS